jgi:hypothetical protein
MREWIKKEVPKDQQSVWEKAAGNWRLPYWDWVRSLFLTPYDGEIVNSLPIPI